MIYEIEDVCEILKIGKSTAYKLVRTNELKAFKIRGIWKVRAEDLNDNVVQSFSIGRK